MSEWISVKDKFPKPEEDVLALYAQPQRKTLRQFIFQARWIPACTVLRGSYSFENYDHAALTGKQYLYRGWYKWDVEYMEYRRISESVSMQIGPFKKPSLGRITHWMPLPELPIQGEENAQG